MSELFQVGAACYVAPMVRGSPNPRYFGLPERLKKARKHARVSRTALAERVGGDQTTALDIETGGRLPTVGTVARLANGLGVSAGWLAFALGEMGGSAQQAACDGMGARLQAVRIAHGLSKAALARLAGLSPTALANIERGAQSGIEVIAALAKALSISPAWLAFNEGPQLLPASRRGRPPAQSPADPR